MPTYDILHKPTGEVTERSMSIASLDTFLKENPEYEVTFRQMTIGDPVALGIKQPPSEFIEGVIKPIERRNFRGKTRESRFNSTREV
jgi:hypothetical protein